MPNNNKKVLFLDRDGVVNQRLIDDYVKKEEEFIFLPGVLYALKELKNFFDRIFIVTNQQGIGKKLMTEKDLARIHSKMIREIKTNGGEVDAVYYCPHLNSEDCDCRKPKQGMYLQALKQYPEISDAQLYMVGDTSSDMQFGNNIGAVKVMISSSKDKINCGYDFLFPSFKKFVEDIHLVLV